MEEERELIRKIRVSLKNKRTNAEIMNALKKKGCNLAYSEELISKAKRPKKILMFSIIVLIILVLATIAVLSMIAPVPKPNSSSSEKQYVIKNPLAGFNVIFEKKPDTEEKTPNPLTNITDNSTNKTKETTDIYIEDVEITPDFISYLLLEIGATESLHKNPLTREKPVINFDIESVEYTAIVDSSIEILDGLSDEADIQFNSQKESMVKAVLSDNPAEVFKTSISEGTTTIERIAGDAELFAKGYLDLYENLK